MQIFSKMAEYDDVERYRKLLEDWKPGPPTKKTSFSSTASVSPMAYSSQKPTVLEKVAKDKAPYGPGSILRLNGRILAVYKKAVPEKEYHLVLILGPGGSVKAQGIALEGYVVEELGSIAPKWLDKLQSEMQWNRDLIVFHCFSYEDAIKVPKFEGGEAPHEEVRTEPQSTATAVVSEPAPAAQSPQAAPAPQPAKPDLNGSLRRGQRLQIRFGNNIWDAVYWGKDTQGQVIAHKTYENWALMHLDLKRFANSMQVDPEADLSLVQEIEQSLLKA